MSRSARQKCPKRSLHSAFLVGKHPDLVDRFGLWVAHLSLFIARGKTQWLTQYPLSQLGSIERFPWKGHRPSRC